MAKTTKKKGRASAARKSPAEPRATAPKAKLIRALLLRQRLDDAAMMLCTQAEDSQRISYYYGCVDAYETAIEIVERTL